MRFGNPGLFLVFLLLVGQAASPESIKLDFFPVVTQFSPVPSGKGWKGEEGPLNEQTIRDTIDNIREHGFTGLEAPTRRPPEEEAMILDYAQSQGMIISYHAGALELFSRGTPPDPCVYSPDYAKAVRANAEAALAPLKNIPRLYNVFTFQDEPFHEGPKSFGYGDAVQAEFKNRYGYELPPSLDAVKNDPKKWLDVLNFRTANFPDGWRQVYKIVKEINPNFITTLTHDSHNTFGAGYSSHSEIAIDDVYHWGGDFSDMFVFDIYPYTMFDFRFGRCAQNPKPRMSQTHYSFAQMRNLTRAYGKNLGFWVGTYNPTWFRPYLCPELQAMYWSEREESITAIAQGANYLLTGYHIPIDAKHWDTFGEGLRLIQKTGAKLLDAPKLKAQACMLFPRTQYLQLQEEFFNAGLSFELFLRAFGELDILHEDQIKDASLDGYQILVLFDVALLPEETAQHIARFVENGGLLIADSVPHLNAYKEPMTRLENLFGVKDAKTDRIRRFGHWVPSKDQPPFWANRPENPPDDSIFTTDRWEGPALDQTISLTLVSPRPCVVTEAEVLSKTTSGQPALIRRKVGSGRAYLLGFCLQDTYFNTFETNDDAGRRQLYALLHSITQDAGRQAHVRSSNPDIEAALRAHSSEAYLFVINHETNACDTTVYLNGLAFPIGAAIDINSGLPVSSATFNNGAATLRLSVPLGEAAIIRLQQEEKAI